LAGLSFSARTSILRVEAVEGAFGGDIDSAMLIKMSGGAPEAAKGRRPGGFEGDSSIFYLRPLFP
jgi:hypothetical protein